MTRTTADTRTSRPRKTPRPISQRYRPSDVVNATTRRPAASAGRLKPRTPAPVVSSGALSTSSNLTPSLGSPRLGAPVRAGSPRSSRSFVGYTPARPAYGYGYGYGNVWGCGWGWNNSWCCNSWGGVGVGIGWGYSPFGCGWATRWSLCSWGCGFNPWTWNVGVLAPYYAWHCNYWNSCYQSTYWNSWSVPNALPSSYWWYPTGTYCPTYLYVPSSVVVVEETTAAPSAGGSAEVIVAGSDVVGSARVSDGAVGDPLVAVGAAATEAMRLAEEYVKLGDFHFQAEQFENAAEAYAKARNYMPEDASVHLVLADAVFANGDYHYAAFLIAEAVRLEPGIVTAETDKREFYGDPKTFDAQMDALQRYCTDKPYDAWAQLLLAYNLRFSDRSARATVAFQRVLELDRDNPTARAFLAELNKPAPAVAPEAGR